MKYFFGILAFIFNCNLIFSSIVVTSEDCKDSFALQKFAKMASSEPDKTLVLDGSKGTFVSGPVCIENCEIHIDGINSPVIDFSPSIILTEKKVEEIRKFMVKNKKWMLGDYDKMLNTAVEKSAGITLKKSDGSSIKNIKVMNAQFAGFYIFCCNDFLIENCEACYNAYQGFRIVGKAGSKEKIESSKITVKNCYAHGNWDYFTLGEEGDGFFIGSSVRNVLVEGCLSECNSDDGFDNCNAIGNIVYKRCVARYNGFREEQVPNNMNKAWDVGSDGGGFGTPFLGTTALVKVAKGEYSIGIKEFSEPVKCFDCVAYKNFGDGFARRRGLNPFYAENCYSVDNGGYSFRIFMTSDEIEDAARREKIAIENHLTNCYEKISYSGSSVRDVSRKRSVDFSDVSVLKTKLKGEEILELLGIDLKRFGSKLPD